jgi:hypothetical protein
MIYNFHEVVMDRHNEMIHDAERKMNPNYQVTIVEVHPGRSIKRVVGVVVSRLLVPVRALLAPRSSVDCCEVTT